MKKIFILTLSIILILLYSCGSETKEKPACTDNTAHCEIQKPWCLMKIISLRDTSSVDAFGDKLKVGDYYIHNNRTKMLFSVAYRQDIGSITPSNLYRLGVKGQEDNNCILLQTAKLDTNISMLAGYYDVVCGVVCLKNAEVLVGNTTKPQSVGWIEYKK